MTIRGTNAGLFRIASGRVLLFALNLTGLGTAIQNGGNITVRRCTVSGSSQDAFVLDGGTALLENSTFALNPNGSAVSANGGTLTIESCTFSGNKRGYGTVASVSSTVNNSIIAGNTNPNAVAGPSTVTNSITTGTAAQAGLRTLNGAPVLEENGGSTPTIALIPGGQAVDAGNTPLSIDQRGLSRPQGSADDIGAY